MQESAEENEGVVNLDDYRTRSGYGKILQLPAKREDAEELLNEIAHHLLMAVRAITSICH
jgi:hypothetical protein